MSEGPGDCYVSAARRTAPIHCFCSNHIHSMTICGTNEYMAPEMMFDEDYNSAVDVYSFGVVIWEVYEPLKSVVITITVPHKSTVNHADNRAESHREERVPCSVAAKLVRIFCCPSSVCLDF